MEKWELYSVFDVCCHFVVVVVVKLYISIKEYNRISWPNRIHVYKLLSIFFFNILSVIYWSIDHIMSILTLNIYNYIVN